MLGEEPVKLTGRQSQELQKALLSAFPDRSELRQMVRFRLEENLETITGGGDLAAIVLDLITWAEASGRVEELVLKARDANPGNPALHAIAEAIEQKDGTNGSSGVDEAWSKPPKPEIPTRWWVLWASAVVPVLLFTAGIALLFRPPSDGENGGGEPNPTIRLIRSQAPGRWLKSGRCLDLDRDNEEGGVAETALDVCFRVPPGTRDVLLDARNEARIAVLGKESPGPIGCRGALPSKPRVEGGTYVCVITNERRYAELRIGSKQRSGFLWIDRYALWENVE